MSNRNQRRSPATDPADIISDLGDKLSEQHGLPVRYVDCIYHDGRQWTRKATWERLKNGSWESFELDLENY